MADQPVGVVPGPANIEQPRKSATPRETMPVGTNVAILLRHNS